MCSRRWEEHLLPWGSGSGLKVKLFNQALVGVYFVGIAEAYLWAKKMGLKIGDLQK